MVTEWKQKIAEEYTKHEKKLEIGFFIGGFIFDIFFLSEIDDVFSLGQQLIYLLIIAWVLHYEILFRLHKWRPQRGLIFKIWSFRSFIMHFLMGSLLSIYSLFYIKSSSLLNSLIFLTVMIALLVANELPLFKKAKVSFKFALYTICLFSFVSILYPLLLGFVGWTPFGLAMVTTMLLFLAQVKLLRRQLQDETLILKVVTAPGISVVMVFTFFYFLGWIPPVPISATEQGIYYNVERQQEKYLLTTQRPWWQFWSAGDQDFKARPGDKIFYYVQIYSPARFSDQVFVKWSFKDPSHGWQKTDRIPLQITGGRKEGFRASTYKTNYQPGKYRVQIETSMGHEIARLTFTVQTDNSIEPRDFKVLTR